MGNVIVCPSKKTDMIKKINRLEEENRRLQYSAELFGKINFREKSHESVKDYVREMLKDSDINIRGVPDCIEQNIYENIIKLFINIIDNVFETTDINLLNHKIMIHLVPSTIN